MKKTIGDLFKDIESENFEAISGPLNHYIPYKIIKDLLYDRLLEPIPKIYRERYGWDDEPSDPSDIHDINF